MSKIRFDSTWSGEDCEHLAPIIDGVEVFHHADHQLKNASGPYSALIDTGADYSTVPQSALQDTKIERTGRGTVFVKYVETGEEDYPEAFFRLKLRICREEIPLETAILWRGKDVKLGRDVLKHSTLTICWRGGKSELQLSPNRTP